MSVVPEEEIKKKDEEIARLIKEIGSIVEELKKATDESKRLELMNQISEKERDLRAARQVRARFLALQPRIQKLW